MYDEAQAIQCVVINYFVFCDAQRHQQWGGLENDFVNPPDSACQVSTIWQIWSEQTFRTPDKNDRDRQ